MSRSVLAVLAALILGYTAHGFADQTAQASPSQGKGASAAQLSAINHKLTTLTNKVSQVGQQDAKVVQILGHGVEGLSIAQVLDQVNGAVSNVVTPNVIATCLTVEQPSGQQASCRG
jgi:hypothetical protein